MNEESTLLFEMRPTGKIFRIVIGYSLFAIATIGYNAFFSSRHPPLTFTILFVSFVLCMCLYFSLIPSWIRCTPTELRVGKLWFLFAERIFWNLIRKVEFISENSILTTVKIHHDGELFGKPTRIMIRLFEPSKGKLFCDLLRRFSSNAEIVESNVFIKHALNKKS